MDASFPAKSLFKALLKGLVWGLVSAAIVGVIFSFPVIGVPVAAALHGVPVLGSLFHAHVALAGSALTGTGTMAATARKGVSVAWKALFGIGAATGAVASGGGNLISRAIHHHKEAKLEQQQTQDSDIFYRTDWQQKVSAQSTLGNNRER